MNNPNNLEESPIIVTDKDTKRTGKIIGISSSGGCYCKKHKHDIDYELVKVLKPNCIEDNNGCGDCPENIYNLEVDAHYDR